MFIRIGYDLIFDVPAPTPMVLMLYVHPERAGDLREPEKLNIEPALPTEEFLDPYGNRCARLLAPTGPLRLRSESVIFDHGLHDAQSPNARQHRADELPTDVLPYLLASRYCEVDRLGPVAWELFGKVDPGWARAKEICNWCQKNVTFGYKFANPMRTAFDVYTERVGVCRDFNHLAVAFCRCMNIPARYATGYLGDIGVPVSDPPMDFSAWFEAYVGGQWYTFDARHNMPRIGRVLIARGQDAADVAISTTFGPNTLSGFTVFTREIAP